MSALVLDFQKYLTYYQLLFGKQTGVCIPGTDVVRRFAPDLKPAASPKRSAASSRD